MGVPWITEYYNIISFESHLKFIFEREHKEIAF